LVTGAGTGVGRALAIELASRGATVFATARALEKCQPLVDEIQAAGGTAFAAVLDVADPQDFARVIETIVDQEGRLDVLVNNAAMMFVGEYYDMDPEIIDHLVRTNLTGVMTGSLFAYRQMRRQGHGRILNISSIVGFMPNPSMSAYGATKFGVRGFSDSLAAEAQEYGVEVQVAFLGLIESEMLEKAEAVNPGATQVHDVIPFRPQPTGIAASRIVRGLERGDRAIFTPGYARLFWYAQRLFPRMIYRGALDSMRLYREVMAEHVTPSGR